MDHGEHPRRHARPHRRADRAPNHQEEVRLRQPVRVRPAGAGRQDRPDRAGDQRGQRKVILNGKKLNEV